MSRIPVPAYEDVPAEARPVLDEIGKRLGFIPNVHRLLALSPASLSGMAALESAMTRVFDVRTREAVALAVSEANGCDYCLAAHSHIAGHFAKVTPEEIALNRQGGSADPVRAAIARLSRRLIETRGKVSDADLAMAREAGLNDRQIIETVAMTARASLTNFMNNVAETAIDFPVLG